MRFKWAATRIAQTRENENQGIVVFGSRALDIDRCAGGGKDLEPPLPCPVPSPISAAFKRLRSREASFWGLCRMSGVPTNHGLERRPPLQIP